MRDKLLVHMNLNSALTSKPFSRIWCFKKDTILVKYRVKGILREIRLASQKEIKRQAKEAVRRLLEKDDCLAC